MNAVVKPRDNKEVAQNIVEQFNLGRLRGMWGAKNFFANGNGLSFAWTAKSRNKANYLHITLNGRDLYDVEFGRNWNRTYTVVSKHTDVFVGDLMSLLQMETGLATKLF